MVVKTRKRQLSELRSSKTSAEDILRAELSNFGKKNPAFAKQITNETTTVKSIQDFENSMALARKAVNQTEKEIETLKAETNVLSQQIEQVIARLTAASLRVLFLIPTLVFLLPA